MIYGFLKQQPSPPTRTCRKNFDFWFSIFFNTFNTTEPPIQNKMLQDAYEGTRDGANYGMRLFYH